MLQMFLQVFPSQTDDFEDFESTMIQRLTLFDDEEAFCCSGTPIVDNCGGKSPLGSEKQSTEEGPVNRKRKRHGKSPPAKKGNS